MRLTALLFLCSIALADVAVRRDGSILRSEIEVAAKEGRLRHGKKLNREASLRSFLLVEKEDGSHVWSAGITSRVAGYTALARKRQREALADLVKSALKARDPALARRLLDRAVALGLEGKTADSLEIKVEKLAAKPGKKKEALSAQVAVQATAAEAIIGNLIFDRAVREMQNGALGVFLLREALRAHPENRPALALLEKRAPKEFALGDNRAWLDWHLEIESPGFLAAKGDELELKRARHHWRPDLYGVRSDEILLITAMKDFELVARCAAHADSTCRALSHLFETSEPVRRDAGPLTVFLYVDKKAYKKHAGDYRSIDNPEFLEWSTGHWSESDDITRIHWPQDVDAERRFLTVLRREIAQHWMHARNPRYSVSQASAAWRQPGYWIQKGFINLIAQGRYDPRAGRWELFNPRCRNLDALQAAIAQQPGRIHPWKSLFLLTGREARKLPDKNDIKLVRRWSLSRWNYSAYHIYLAQAGAACQFLYHAEDGKYRKQFFDALVAHYRGEGAKLNPKAAFGLGADDLGKKVEAFAQSVAQGWRPKER